MSDTGYRAGINEIFIWHAIVIKWSSFITFHLHWPKSNANLFKNKKSVGCSAGAVRWRCNWNLLFKDGPPKEIESKYKKTVITSQQQQQTPSSRKYFYQKKKKKKKNLNEQLIWIQKAALEQQMASSHPLNNHHHNEPSRPPVSPPTSLLKKHFQLFCPNLPAFLHAPRFIRLLFRLCAPFSITFPDYLQPTYTQQSFHRITFFIFFLNHFNYYKLLGKLLKMTWMSGTFHLNILQFFFRIFGEFPTFWIEIKFVKK